MRILVSTSTFPSSLDDGIPRFVYDLAESLAAHAQVTVLAPGTSDASGRTTMGTLDVRRFGYFWPRRLQRLTPSGGQGMSDKMRESWLAWGQVMPFLVRQRLATRRLVRELDIDVVNAHWIVPQGLTAAWALGRRHEAKLLLHVHAADVYLLQRLPLGRVIARYVVKRCDAIFSAGSHVRDCLDELLGFPSNAQLQPMGVHLELFRRPQNADATAKRFAADFLDGYVLFVGRFVEKKGTAYLIRALPHVLQQIPHLGLVLVGSGAEENNLRREVETLGLERLVRFVGRQTHGEIVELLRDCRVAVVPSIIDSRGETEGMPTVVIEAMSAGVRVVGSAVDGIPDIINHEQNGWLCRPKDPDDLAAKILTALNDPTPSAVTQSAIETSQRFGWPQVAANYLECMQRLVNGEKAAT
ncbi:MAG: glycosyltransferase [Planctomycetaceae bacterium]